MLRTISPQDMQEMERAFLDGTGYPSLLLMEHAAQEIVRALSELAPAEARVLFLCGSGNNGGDGCAAARLWLQRGGKASVWMLRSPSQMRGDAGINAALLKSCGAEVTVLYGEAPEIPDGCAAAVDALFGTGLSRALEGAALEAVRRVRASGLPVVAVDIPSGVDGATGQIEGEALPASVTVAFHRAKHGHLIYPGRAYAGRLIVADIGILPDWDGAQGIDVLEAEDARALLPSRPTDGHKGTFGHVLTVAGSEGMGGAASLCAEAALRAGCGLVTAACPLPVLSVLQARVPCAMAQVVSDGFALDAGAADALERLARGKGALALGPVLGRSEETWTAIEPLVSGDTPKVVDADALFLMAQYGGRAGANTVLTPHPGEMARLCGTSTKSILAAPVDYAQQLAADTGTCVLLKGSTTVIVQGEDTAMNVTGCDAMGTGGCGDVLTGVIAGLMGQGASCWDAARLGAFYHGLAGEAAARQRGARAVTALDLLDCLRIE